MKRAQAALDAAGAGAGYCSARCRTEHAKEKRNTLAVNRAREAADKEWQEQELITQKLHSYRLLQAGVDFVEWAGPCGQCGKTVISPEHVDECKNCGADWHLQLREYGDGYRRLVAYCYTCRWESIVHAMQCRCGGRARIADVVVRTRVVNYGQEGDSYRDDKGLIFAKVGEIEPRIISVPPPLPSDKSRWLGFFLCALFGVMGVHRFYAGKWVTGMVWLCTLGLFYIGWIVDALLLLAGKFKDADGNYLK